MESVSSTHVAAACLGREGACLPETAPRCPRAAHLGVGRSCHPGMWLVTCTSHAALGSARPCGCGALLTTHPQVAAGGLGDMGLHPPPDQDVSAFKSQKI